MKASEYITMLQALVTEYGDLECEDEYGFSIEYPEECEGVFVLATHANNESARNR